jgi:GMP synthase (glutamine-hydrolysing)
LPRDAIVLARGDAAFPNQAFRFGTGAFALQFHPEVTYQMMCRWTVRGFERLKWPGARAPHEHLDGWRQHDQAVARWLEAFLPRWILGVLPAADYGAAPAAPLAAAAYPEV